MFGGGRKAEKLRSASIGDRCSGASFGSNWQRQIWQLPWAAIGSNLSSKYGNCLRPTNQTIGDNGGVASISFALKL